MPIVPQQPRDSQLPVQPLMSVQQLLPVHLQDFRPELTAHSQPLVDTVHDPSAVMGNVHQGPLNVVELWSHLEAQRRAGNMVNAEDYFKLLDAIGQSPDPNVKVVDHVALVFRLVSMVLLHRLVWNALTGWVIWVVSLSMSLTS